MLLKKKDLLQRFFCICQADIFRKGFCNNGCLSNATQRTLDFRELTASSPVNDLDQHKISENKLHVVSQTTGPSPYSNKDKIFMLKLYEKMHQVNGDR